MTDTAPTDGFNMDEVDLCKGCGTMKHLDKDGLCGRCVAPTNETVTIYEVWEEKDGQIWYKWRVEGEKEWHYKLTSHKEKPWVSFKHLTPIEFEEFKSRLTKGEG